MPEWLCNQCERRFYSTARSDLIDPHCPVCGGMLALARDTERDGDGPERDRDGEPLKDGRG